MTSERRNLIKVELWQQETVRKRMKILCHTKFTLDNIQVGVIFSSNFWKNLTVHKLGRPGLIGTKIHFIAYFYYESAIWNTQYTCLYLYIISTFEAL